MNERYIENVYKDTVVIINQFNEIETEKHSEWLHDLEDVHDVPEIGTSVLLESRLQVQHIIDCLEHKVNLSPVENELLDAASSLANEIEFNIMYSSGENRVFANHTVSFDLQNLRKISNSIEYQHCLDFLEDHIKELFESKHGIMPGTSIFYSTLNVLSSFYYFTQIMDGLSKEDNQLILSLVCDVAKNLGPAASEYLIKKDPIFLAKN